jgi:glutamate carboxypeptidase
VDRSPAEIDVAAARAFCEGEREWLLALIRRLVELESPSSDRDAVNGVIAEVEASGRAHGATATRVSNADAGDHLRLEFGRGERQVLLLGHVDTVWPVGQLGRMPLRLENGRLHGPGVFDMKAGIGLGLLAVRALQRQQLLEDRRVVLLLTSDEEVGSRTSRALIEAETDRSAAVLVLEPAMPDGGVKTSRKGVGDFRIDVHGRAAHAGLEPERGISAIVELAHQVLALQALTDHAAGVSVTVGRISGGTRTNVVPEYARADVDVRLRTLADAERVCGAIRGLRPTRPDVRIEVTGGMNRPPMERTAGVAALYEVARQVASELGGSLTEGSSGGGSDGNFAAARGVPTIDGLGPLGDGAHALHEHVLVTPLAWRAALIAGVVARVP